MAKEQERLCEQRRDAGPGEDAVDRPPPKHQLRFQISMLNSKPGMRPITHASLPHYMQPPGRGGHPVGTALAHWGLACESQQS